MKEQIISALALIQSQILAALAARPPKPENHLDGIPTEWYAVCWDFAKGCFDPDTLRREPDVEHPQFHKRPYLYPWIYIPAQPNVTILTAKYHRPVEPTAAELRLAAVEWLNSVCTWQTPREIIWQHVATLGGIMLHSAATGIIPDHVPPPRYRKPVTVRRRSRVQASQLQHTTAKIAVRREELRSRATARGQQFTDHNAEPHQLVGRCFQAVPQSNPKVKKHTDDELAAMLGKPSFAEEILAAMRQKQDDITTEHQAAERNRRRESRNACRRKHKQAGPPKEYIPAASRVMFMERMMARCTELGLRPIYAQGVEPLAYMGQDGTGYTARLFICQPISG